MIENNNNPAAGNIGITDTGEVIFNIQDVVIPPEKAGIGDIIMVQNINTVVEDMVSSNIDFKIIKGNTYNKGLSGYLPFGVIYGFEDRNTAMVVHKEQISSPFLTGKIDGQNYAGGNSIAWNQCSIGLYSSGAAITNNYGKTRYGLAGGYKAMNIERVKNYTAANQTDSASNVHPTSAYGHSSQAATGPMKISTYNSNANNVKNIYNTYESYLNQLSPIGNGDPSIFNSKYHLGKAIGRQMMDLGGNRSDSFGVYALLYSAHDYCCTRVPQGLWWLPDMVELRQLMRDQTIKKINPVLTKLGSPSIDTGSHRWSSVLYSGTYAWHFSWTGMSSWYWFSNSLLVRAVTNIKIRNI